MVPELDHVTGLLPRGPLERAFAAAVGEGRPITAVMADVVGLKSINETHGFAAGDAALSAAAERFQDVTGRAQIVARLGGDELVAVFAGEDAHARACAAAAALAADTRQPSLRSTWSPYAADEDFAGFIDRLYAMLRQC